MTLSSNNPKVSIVTVSYNSAETIEDTIKTVLAQNYNNIEYVIIDGGSKDNTLEIIDKYRADIDIVISEKDNGIYDAMNKGVNLATGDIIGILNSDDLYAHDKVVSNIVNRMIESNAEAAYADLLYVDREDTDKITRYWASGSFRKENFKYGWMPPHPTFFTLKTCYEKFGTYNLSLKSAADYELMLRFLYKNNVKTTYLPEVVIKMRVGGQSNASLKNRLMANNEDQQAWKINNLKPYWFTLKLKPLRKILQFIRRPKK